MKLATCFVVVAASTLVAEVARADEPPANANASASMGVAAREPLGSPPPAPAPPPKSSLLPIVLVGSGLAVATVGVILVVAAPKVPATCNTDLHTCVRQPGESPEDFANDQDRAGRAHTMPIAGWLTIGIGGMLAAAGGLTYLFGPEGRHVGSTTTRLTPYAGPSGGGLAAVGTF